MSKQELSVTKKRGRPKGTGTKPPTAVIRLPVSVIAQIDGWIARQPEPKPSRAEAIEQLVTDEQSGR